MTGTGTKSLSKAALLGAMPQAMADLPGSAGCSPAPPLEDGDQDEEGLHPLSNIPTVKASELMRD